MNCTKWACLFIKWIFKQCIVHALEAEVRVSSMSNLKVRSLSESELELPHSFMTISNTTWTSHIKTYLGWGGFLVKTSLSRTHTCLCCPTSFFSMICWNSRPVQIYWSIDLFLYPKSKSSARKSKIKFTEHWTGWISFQVHRLNHFPQENLNLSLNLVF